MFLFLKKKKKKKNIIKMARQSDAGRGFPGFAADESDEDINDMPWNWGRISREDAVAELAGRRMVLSSYA